MLKIESERRRRNWTQVQLAFYAAIQPSDVSRYETGRMRPYASHAERLARVLGLRPDELQEPAEQEQ